MPVSSRFVLASCIVTCLNTHHTDLPHVTPPGRPVLVPLPRTLFIFSPVSSLQHYSPFCQDSSSLPSFLSYCSRTHVICPVICHHIHNRSIHRFMYRSTPRSINPFCQCRWSIPIYQTLCLPIVPFLYPCIVLSFHFHQCFSYSIIVHSANICHIYLFYYRNVLVHISHVMSYVTTRTTVLSTVLFTNRHPVLSTRSTNAVGPCLSPTRPSCQTLASRPRTQVSRSRHSLPIIWMIRHLPQPIYRVITIHLNTLIICSPNRWLNSYSS